LFFRGTNHPPRLISIFGNIFNLHNLFLKTPGVHLFSFHLHPHPLPIRAQLDPAVLIRSQQRDAPESLQGFRMGQPVTQRLENERFVGLMAHDRVVAALIAQDKSNYEIAETMVGNVKTMETYVMCILNKLEFDTQLRITT